MSFAPRRLAAALLTAAIVVAGLPLTATAQEPHDHSGGAPAGALRAVASGSWSAPATWGGRVPAPHAEVVIPAGRDVVLDVSPPHLMGLTVEGTLRFARKNLTLRSAYVMVHGALRVGTATSPFLQRATIVLDGPATDNVHGMGNSVLGVMGGTLDLHGRPRPVPWTRLSRTATPGTWRINVLNTRGWRRGDRIVVSSTDFDPLQAEERTVTRIVGRVVTLDRPLAHHHHGGTEKIAGRWVPQRAEVANLTRNIVVRGRTDANATGRGGHTMIHTGSRARISDVEFRQMGQAGVMGRYPVHFHVAGDMSASYVRRASIHHSNSRCLTIHGTHSVRVSQTIGYDTRGHCFFLEDGVETDNQLRSNLGLVTRRPAPGKALLESDNQPATYWISNPSNTLVGNVAAGSEGNGFWYDLPERTSGMFADLELNPRTMPMGTFSGNTAHSNNNASGQFRSGSGLLVEDYEPPSPAVFNGLLAYKNRGFGAWAEGITVANSRFVGNEVGFLGRFATLRDSLAVGHSPNNRDIPWSMIGTGFYVDESTVSNVTYARFRNHEWRHGAAIGSIVEHQSTIPRVSRARFISSRRVRVPAAWMEDGHEPGVAFRDVDGSVLGTGKPSTIVANNPLLLTPGCRRVDWIEGSSCPANLSLTSLRMVDMTGGTQSLIPTQVTREDGASDPAWPGHDWRPVAQATVLMGNHYALRPQRTTPATTELTFANDQRGSITVAVPWTHGQPYVYDGWGLWAEPIEPAASAAEFEAGGKYLLSGGMLKVKFRNDGYYRWQRQMLCAQRGCGENLGIKRGG